MFPVERESYLHLNSTDITDVGLVHLVKLENLVALNISDTSVTDKGLLHLRGLKNLKVATAYECEITNPTPRGKQPILPGVRITSFD